MSKSECPCIDEETEACVFNEHNKCDQKTIPHSCMCICHTMSPGDHFQSHGQSFVKVLNQKVVREEKNAGGS